MKDQKQLNEKETVTRYFGLAKYLGCEKEFAIIYRRYDELLKKCKNAKEYEEISIMGNVEIHKFFGFKNPLYVNGKLILPADPSWSEEKDLENLNKF